VKKRDIKKITVQKQLEINRFLDRLKERHRKHRRRHAKVSGVATPSYANKKFAGAKWVDYSVPAKLDLVANRTETCDFFQKVRHAVGYGQKVRLVFMDTDAVSSESLIYLLAQFQKLRLQHGVDCITGTYPRSVKIERLLTDSGFLKMLGVRPRKLKGRPASSTRFVKCKSDTVMNSKYIPELRDELMGDDLEMPQQVGKMVFRALSEAMANVNHHAYENKKISNGLVGRWWLGAQLSTRKNYFELTFYDAGVGIPKTLHRKYTAEMIRGALSLLPGILPDDAQMIQAAVELGRSRTGLDNRGKGLLDIHSLITKLGAGSLTIFSRGGRYRYDSVNGASSQNDQNFVEGTLIKWEIPLDRVTALSEPKEALHATAS
jgi:hypothetical protein